MKIQPGKKYGKYTLLLMFFIFAFAGWSWEIIYHLLVDHAFINRGVLFGPWLPIYGCGAVLILVLFNRMTRHPVLLFFSIMLLAGILEYITSWYLETYQGVRWWDYRGCFLNIQGRVCLIGLLVFGIGGCLVLYYLAPWLNRMINKISPRWQKAIGLALLFCFAVDLIYSIKNPNTGAGITFPVSGFPH